MTEAGRCYVYAILARQSPLSSGLVGLGGDTLSTVPWRDLAAATSRLAAGDLQPTVEHVLRHAEIVEELWQLGPVLPVRFGTVLADAAAVAQALAARYAVLAADLERLGDKVEFGLSVLWEQPAIDDEQRREAHDRSPAAPEAAAAPGRGAQYLQARLAEHQRMAAARDRARVFARDLDSVLGAHALERRCTILPTSRLALRTAYLLEPSQVQDFRQTFDRLRLAYPQLRFLLSGPWPPYSFVTPAEADFMNIRHSSIMQEEESK